MRCTFLRKNSSRAYKELSKLTVKKNQTIQLENGRKTRYPGFCPVVSNSSRPHGLQPTRLLRPWDFPGKSTGVGAISFSSIYRKHYVNIRNYHQQAKAHPVKTVRREWGSEEEGTILANNQVCHPKLGQKERLSSTYYVSESVLDAFTLD